MSAKTAIISDVHGNTAALEAVLNDIDQRGISRICNLGDSLYGPLDPEGTFDLLAQRDIVSISGNEDRTVLEDFQSAPRSATMEYVLQNCTADTIQWLQSLPFDTALDNGIYCCHGTPADDTEYLLEHLSPGRVSIRKNTAIDTILNNIKQPVAVCGHSHVPRIVDTGARLVINPGSTGLPAYDDDSPVEHCMESFTPRADYAVVTMDKGAVTAELVSVPYDYEFPARLAEQNRRPDWARWIRTGRAETDI